MDVTWLRNAQTADVREPEPRQAVETTDNPKERYSCPALTDPDGRRHSLDVRATSTFDAAHLYVTEAKKERAVGLPKPTLATVFDVVAEGKVYRVKGEALQKWIVERRQKWQGP